MKAVLKPDEFDKRLPNNNELIILPKQIISLTKLRSFSIFNNQLENPLQELADKGFETIVSIFKSENSTEFIHHLKLITLGKLGSGKATLCSQLQQDGFIGKHQTLMTNTNNTRPIEISIIDFSNLSIHEIFFSVHSLYLICINLENYRNYNDIYLNIII